MAANGQDIVRLARTGRLNKDELSSMFANATTNDVSIEDWGACYSSATGQLNEYCTVTANDQNNLVTGVGMLLYSSDGLTLYAAQYTNGVESAAVATSVATNQYNTQSGSTVLCIVYGWTQNASFYSSQMMTVASC